MELTSGNNISELAGNRLTEVDYAEALENFVTDMDWRLIHTSMYHTEFTGSPIWISKKLNIPLDKVTTALYGLISIGMAEIADNKFRSNMNNYFFSTEKVGMTKLISSFKDLSMQHLSSINEASQKGTAFYTVAANEELINNFRQKIRTALSELVEESKASKNEKFYTISVSTNEVGENGGAK